MCRVKEDQRIQLGMYNVQLIIKNSLLRSLYFMYRIAAKYNFCCLINLLITKRFFWRC